VTVENLSVSPDSHCKTDSILRREYKLRDSEPWDKCDYLKRGLWHEDALLYEE
jgi:hypothetical protein